MELFLERSMELERSRRAVACIFLEASWTRRDEAYDLRDENLAKTMQNHLLFRFGVLPGT